MLLICWHVYVIIMISSVYVTIVISSQLSAFCPKHNGGAGEKAKQQCNDWRHTSNIDPFALVSHSVQEQLDYRD